MERYFSIAFTLPLDKASDKMDSDEYAQRRKIHIFRVEIKKPF
jgi:hypothetical protein